MNLNLTKILLQMRFKGPNSGSPINYTQTENLPFPKKTSKLGFLKRKIQGIYKSGSNDIKITARVPLFHRKKFLFALFALIFISIPVALISLQSAKKAAAAWFDDSWAYRKAIAIPSHTTTETNVYVTVPTFDATDTTKFQADCGDLRFTKQNGELLPYYVVDCDATANIHVQFDSLPSGTSTYFMYYGNPTSPNGFETADFSVAASGLGTQALATEEQSQGPVAYWKFDEGYGSTANDSTTNANNGSLGVGTSAPTWTSEDQCISGKCLSFDGTNDVVTVSNTVSGIKTVSFWVKPITTSEQFIDLNGSAYIQSSSGTISATGFTSPTIYVDGQVSSTIVANKWQFVSITTGTALSGSTIKIGQISTNFGQGFIDDVKIYPYARTAAQIKSDYISHGSVKGTSVALGGSSTNSDALSNGLVAYWKMDETATPSIDSSGNGNSGTWYGTTAATSGKFGNSAIFDGDSDYISVPSNDTLRFIGSNFSVSSWIYLESSVNGGLVYKGQGTIRKGYGMYQLSSTLYFIYSDTTITTDHRIGIPVTIGNWYHATMTIDKQTNLMSVYINGLPQGTMDITGIDEDVSETLALEFGKSGSFYSNGRVDETRIYNRALSPTEVRDLYNWAPGPIAYYPFDEGTGISTVYDKSGNGGTGTMYNFSSSSWVQGKYGKALQFNDSNNSIDISNVSHPYQFTKMAWIKPNTSNCADRCTIMDPYFEIYITNLTFYSYQLDPPGWHTASNVLSSNEWQHVAVSYDGTNLKLFRNGVQVYSSTPTRTTTITSTSEIGKLSTTRYFSGAIDDVKIYNYARTSGQIIEDMNAGHPLGGSPVGSQLAYYKFDEGYSTTANNSGFGGTTLNGNITNGTWSNTGKFNKALSFGETSSVTTTITDPGYTNTLSLWLNPSTSIASKTLITATKLTTDSSSRPVYGNCTGTALSLSTWTHLVAVSDGSGSCKIFQNGVQTASSTTGVTFGTSVNIGASSFTGLIDEVKIYNAALTADEILLDYNHGSAMVLGSTSTTSAGAADNSSAGEYCVPGSSDSCSAPVAEWKMDEKTGTNANDTSGNGNTGVFSGSPIWKSSANCKLGACLYFNGSSYIEANIDSLDLTDTTYTIEGWYNLTSVASSRFTIFGFRQGSNSAYKYLSLELWTDAGNLVRIFVGDGTNYDTLSPGTTTTGIGSLAHIAVVRNGTSINTYINGKLLGTVSSSKSADLQKFLIATRSDSNFIGLIDNVKIYNYARTPAQIAWDYNRGAPVGHWKLDECQGTIANDSSGNGNNGTITAGDTSGSNDYVGTCTGSAGDMWKDGAIGKYNSSLEFDGTNDYVTTATATSLGIDSGIKPFTISSWIKTTSSSEKYIFDNYDGGNHDISLRIDTGKVETYIRDASANNNGTPQYGSGYNDGNWHHFILTWNGAGKETIFVDGIQIGTTTSAAITGSLESSSAFTIGTRPGGGGFFDGQIDDVRIYNYALTPTQIKTLFNENSSVRFGQ